MRAPQTCPNLVKCFPRVRTSSATYGSLVSFVACHRAMLRLFGCAPAGLSSAEQSARSLAASLGCDARDPSREELVIPVRTTSDPLRTFPSPSRSSAPVVASPG